MDLVKLKPLIYYGRCAHCQNCDWKLDTIGHFTQERIVGRRKIPKRSKQCLSCNKYNEHKWWFGAIYTPLLLIPTGIAGAYFFPGKITYPTSISPQVFFVGIPIFLLYANLLLAIMNPFFPTNKIINPPKEQDN